MTEGRADSLIVLIPSPLVGAYSWSLVAEGLQARGRQALVSIDLRNHGVGEPAWRQTVDGVARTLGEIPSDQSVVLVGHSAAGPLLPAIGSSLAQPISAYLFVDARLPGEGSSRLDAIEADDPAIGAERRATLAAGGQFPVWTDDDLRDDVPDPDRRRALLEELRPRGADFWMEPLPMVTNWPDAPCGYLLFSSFYRFAADRAHRAGWPVRELPAGHFHALVDPGAVTDALLSLLDETGARRGAASHPE
jgi:pimeloyl-ACP methyl ester carboxylesterase